MPIRNQRLRTRRSADAVASVLWVGGRSVHSLLANQHAHAPVALDKLTTVGGVGEGSGPLSKVVMLQMLANTPLSDSFIFCGAFCTLHSRYFLGGPAPHLWFIPPPSSSLGKMTSMIASDHSLVLDFKKSSPRKSSCGVTL